VERKRALIERGYRLTDDELGRHGVFEEGSPAA
jgi:hypothetical protein